MTGPAFTPPPATEPWPGWGQSLYAGAAGVALLHIEHARAGTGDWHAVHAWMTAMTRRPVTASSDASGLHHGVPAVAFTLHASGQPSYRDALDCLDQHVTALTYQRLRQGHDRITIGRLPALAEYDLIRGLTGLGVYALHRHGDSEATRAVLAYLVRLTRPLTVDGTELPGWWTPHGPADTPAVDWPGGHANLGMAHGISGPLALLALAHLRGIRVPGQAAAIERVCAFLDAWKLGEGRRGWWPGMVSTVEYRAGSVDQDGPQRPSWCYGTPGLARAQQLAGLALGDLRRQEDAEQALAGCVTDDAQLDQLRDGSLCHGWAGLVYAAWRVARSSADPDAFPLTALAHRLQDHLNRHGPPTDPHLLDGRAGILLAHNAVTAGAPPHSGWDAALLLHDNQPTHERES